MTTTSSTTSARSSQPVGSDIDYGLFLDCVHCGLCTAACPTYLETGNENDSPRGRIYLMRGVVDGRLELTDAVTRHLDLCLDCRSCETACPSGVQYGRLIEPFRVDMRRAEAAAGRDPASGWFHRLILFGLFPYVSRLRWALLPARWMQRLGADRLIERMGLLKLLPEKLRRMQALLPRLQPAAESFPDVLPPVGKKRARVALFTGCVAEAMFSQTNRATARVLQANGCEVVIPRNQACCGAIHYHNGADRNAMKLAAENVTAFDVDGVDAVIINVAGCGSMLKDYGHIADELDAEDDKRSAAFKKFAEKVKDVSEFLAELGPVRPAGAIPLRATYHDACHLAHAQQVRSQPRELLSLIPELELVPLPESDICCGAAGSYNLTEPEMSDRLAERKVNNVRSVDPQIVVSGNAGCTLQIQAALHRSGSEVSVLHPMELLDMSYRGVVPEVPAVSSR
jgi:glycolate oxidase iron-sulfur subunit